MNQIVGKSELKKKGINITCHTLFRSESAFNLLFQFHLVLFFSHMEKYITHLRLNALEAERKMKKKKFGENHIK